MARLIKRYGSRKLYDTAESRYVSLEDIAAWVRSGEEINVLDNATSEDVTSQTLTQVISEEGRKKAQFLSPDLLHDLIRAGETAVSSRVKQLQSGMDRFVKKSIDKLVPVSSVRDEMSLLRSRLDELEKAIVMAETKDVEAPKVEEKAAEEAKPKRAPRKKPATTTAKKTTTRKTTTRKASTPKTTVTNEEETNEV